MSERYEIPRDVVLAVKASLEKILDADFGGARAWGAQSKAERVMKISQTQISDILAEKAGKLGIGTVLAIHDYLKSRGRPLSVDQILGLSADPAKKSTEDLLIQAAAEIAIQRREAAEALAASQERVNAERTATEAARRPKRTREKAAIRAEKDRVAKKRTAESEPAPAASSERSGVLVKTGTHGRGR